MPQSLPEYNIEICTADIIIHRLMSRFELKPKAYAMRRAGKSIIEIYKTLGISKSTASLWCREIKLTDKQAENLKRNSIKGGLVGRQKGADTNRQKKIDAQNNANIWAQDFVSSISERDRLVAGIALYWAEGSKAVSTTGFIFVNSDPVMIRFMYEWLTDVIKIPKEDITAQVSINEIHRYRINKVLKFWSRLLDLPLDTFSRTFFAKSLQKKVYDNHSVHYGVFRLGVKRSTLLKYKVLKMIDILKAEVAQPVGAVVS